MKKSIIVLVIALVAILVSGCLPAPRVPVDCGGETKKVKLEDVAAYKEACDIASGKTSVDVSDDVKDSCNCNCQNTPATNQPAMVAKQPETVVDTAVKCSYDYGFMPNGKDTNGVPLADYGVINFLGTVEGPAIVQLDSLTIVSVHPGETFTVSDATDPVWKYAGNLDCLLAQYQYFPNKTIVDIQ